MIELSEAAAIAIHATVFLSRNADEPQSLKTIAAASDVSENHLSKVLQKLAKAGIVASVKGPKGGYYLTDAARTATLMTASTAPARRPAAAPCGRCSSKSIEPFMNI